MYTNWLKSMFLKLDSNKELKQAVDGESKEIYILMIKVKLLFPFS